MDFSQESNNREKGEGSALLLLSRRVKRWWIESRSAGLVGGRYAILNKFSWPGLLPSGEPNGMVAD